eukprot:s98_g13.t3
MADTKEEAPSRESPEPQQLGQNPPGEPVFWGQKWHEGGFEKNVIHFDKTAKVMRDIFEATQGFQKELGTRYTFLDIACAPGGFSRFMCSDPRCERGWGISLPVTEGGFRLLFTWSTPDERKFQVKFRDMLTLEPEDCCEHQVDMVISDAQYLPLRKADQPGPDPALAKAQSLNPALGIWALLFQQLRLGLCNLRNGGVMMFRLNCKDGNVDWYFDCVCQVLAMVDRLFDSMMLFKSGKSHQSDGTAYIICRGFCRCEYEAMQGAELLRKSIMVSRYEPDVVNLSEAPIFRRVAPSRDVRARTREVFSLVDDAINRYKDPASFSYTSTVKEWRCARSVPSLRRTVRSTLGKVMPAAASRIAAQQLERAADDVAGISRKLDEIKDVDSLRAELAELCQRTISSLRERAAEVQQILKATEETQIEEENLDDLRTGVLDDGWARTAEPEAAPSQSLHVTGLLQGIEESTLQRCFGRAGKVEEIRFLPQDQAMASRCSALVRMSSCDEAKVAREKLDGIIPEGTGFEMERNLMITFQVKNGIQVCDHLFVRGIPSAVQKHQVASLFNRYGEVLWSSILPPRMDEQDRCALVQMASSDQAQNAIQALNWTTSSALMPAMMVRYAGHKVFAALRANDDGIEEADQGSEEEEDDDDYAHYGVIEEAPKPAFQPLKERPLEMGSRWKKHEEADDDGPEGTRLWGWAMQPVKEKEEFPELGQQDSAALPDDSQSKIGRPVQQVQNGYPGQVESWELEVEPGPCEFLCMKDAPSGLPESVMQMWFKPYGHVVEMRPLWRASTPGRQAFLVHMSCVEEAINAVEALNGKSIMKGKPLLLEYWHGPVDDAEEPPQESSAPTGLDKSKLLEAVRAMGKKKSSPEAAQSTLNGTQTMRPGPCTGISDAQLLEACRAALAKRKPRTTEVAPSQPSAAVPADSVEEEAPVLEEAALQEEAQDEKAIPEEDDDKESWEAWASDDETGADCDPGPTDCICMTGTPAGMHEMVMQMWFKPHGQVRQFRALTPAETGLDKPAFLVQMGSADEAAAAVSSLNGKAIMKGQQLVLEYWRGGK